MKIDKNNIQKIIKGASILGGGGGGKLSKAQELARRFTDSIKLIPLDELQDNQTAITCFGVGGLEKDGDIEKTINNNLDIFQQSTGISVDAVIPVEVGPVSIMAAILTAQILKLPLVDSDLVGFRAAPEVYLELITLGKLSRTPLVIGNDKNETLLIQGLEDLEGIEDVLRNFSRVSDSKTYVLGYPLKVSQLKKYSGKGSVTESKLLANNFSSQKLKMKYKFIGRASIQSQEPLKAKGGFSSGRYVLKALNGNATYTIYFKNENLVLLENEKVLLTCPDNIMLVDTQTGFGINNGNENIGKEVNIFASKSLDLWRTKEGMKLFSPTALGFNFNQKTL